MTEAFDAFRPSLTMNGTIANLQRLKIEKENNPILQELSFLCVRGFQDWSPNMAADMPRQIEPA